MQDLNDNIYNTKFENFSSSTLISFGHKQKPLSAGWSLSYMLRNYISQDMYLYLSSYI